MNLNKKNRTVLEEINKVRTKGNFQTIKKEIKQIYGGI